MMGAEWDQVRVLLHRASELRRFAARLDGSVLRDLPALAGRDTWLGPSADAFRATLRRAGLLLDDAVADLRAGAARLEHEADEVAIAFRSTGVAS